jgi:plasmid replication initiation protein
LIISRIKPDDKDFQEYRFNVQDILKDLELGTDNQTYLRQTTLNLLGRSYEIPVGKTGVIQLNPISSAVYNDEHTEVTFRFDPNAKGHYLELKSNYTQFQLEIVLGLKSVYSQKLYEIAKSMANKGDPTVRYSVAEWRYLLYIEPEEYKEYKDFRKRIFNTAQKELDEKTDIHLEFREEKSGKRINWLWMEVHKIENEEQRQEWLRQTKFNQLPKKVRESLLQSSGAAGKSTLDDIAKNVAARQKAIAEAEEMGLFDKKTDISIQEGEENEG